MKTNRLWRHAKRGGLYVEIDRVRYEGEGGIEGILLAIDADGLLRQAGPTARETAELQTGRPLRRGEVIVLYMGEDFKIWARPQTEFDDGRFLPAKAKNEDCLGDDGQNRSSP